MEHLLTELVEILWAEIACHQALEAELAAEAAQDGQHTGAQLLALQSRKNQIVYSVREQESRRKRVVAQLARAWGEPTPTLTLREIIVRAQAEAGAALARCHMELQGQIARIRELAAITSANAQARLKAIDATLAVVRDAMKIHPTYSEEGRLHKRTPTLKSTSA